MRKSLALLLLILGSVSMADGPATRSTSSSDFDGEWVVASSTGDGAGDVFSAMILRPVIIKDGRISWVEYSGEDGKGNKNWCRVSRKLVRKPEISADAVDIVAGGNYKAWSRVGIAKIVDKDYLQLCVHAPPGPRPAKFEKADDGSEFVVLRRVIEEDQEHKPGQPGQP